MKIKLVIKIIAIFGLLSVKPLFSENLIRVKEIEFRGLNYLTKREVIKDTRVKGVKGEIVIDLDSLNNSLKSAEIVDRYAILEKESRLIVDIKEKKPYIRFALKKGRRLILFEVDKNFNAISKKRIYSRDNPIIIIGMSDLYEGRIKDYVKKTALLIKDLERKSGSFYREISEVSIIKSDMLSVKLNKRRTRFILEPGRSEFLKMRHMAEYFEKINYYPKRLYITKSGAIIRP